MFMTLFPIDWRDLPIIQSSIESSPIKKSPIKSSPTKQSPIESEIKIEFKEPGNESPLMVFPYGLPNSLPKEKTIYWFAPEFTVPSNIVGRNKVRYINY